MKKLLIALALVAASAAPALADYGKEQTTPHHQRLASGYERHADVRKMPAAPNLRQANDPYWTPCDYTSKSDVNTCF
jgi:hypothetical protein